LPAAWREACSLGVLIAEGRDPITGRDRTVEPSSARTVEYLLL
jgi:hypothetical protein